MEPAPGAPLDNDHHVLRYVRGRHVDNGEVDGEAFLARRDKDADGLSVNWLEWFSGSLEDQVAGARGAARLTYKSTDRLARLNVGRSINFVRENHPEHLKLSFIHDPLPAEGKHAADPSHSLIVGAPFEDAPDAELLGDLIAQSVLSPVFPARAPTVGVQGPNKEFLSERR
jgi:hypothetical protein